MSNLRTRIIRGLGATALTPAVTAAIQFGTVPVLLHAWGAAKYGDWIVLSAIPSYLSLSDLGFGNAAGSDMTVRVAAGDREGALRTFQSSWALLTAVSLAIMIALAAGAWAIPWQQWFHLSSLSSRRSSSVVLVLGAYILMWQQSSLLESAFRCDGHFAVGTLLGSIVRLGEAIVATAVGVATGSFVALGLTYLVARLLGTIAFALVLAQKSPWILLGIKYARWNAVRALAVPAFGFVVLPLAQALSLQGSTLILGALEGPIAVTVFSTMRTLTRLNFQAVNAIARVLWPELSSAFGSGDIPLARRLHRRAFQASLALSVLSVAALWAAGPWLYRVWIHGSVVFDTSCFHVLLLVSVAGSLWYTSSVVPMSTNAHHNVATTYFAATCLSLVAVWVVTPRFGITSTALALLAAEVSMVWIVVRTALRQVDDPVGRFAADVLTSYPAIQGHRVAREALD